MTPAIIIKNFIDKDGHVFKTEVVEVDPDHREASRYCKLYNLQRGPVESQFVNYKSVTITVI